jgi:hypothetical protein
MNEWLLCFYFEVCFVGGYLFSSRCQKLANRKSHTHTHTHTHSRERMCVCVCVCMQGQSVNYVLNSWITYVNDCRSHKKQLSST